MPLEVMKSKSQSRFRIIAKHSCGLLHIHLKTVWLKIGFLKLEDSPVMDSKVEFLNSNN